MWMPYIRIENGVVPITENLFANNYSYVYSVTFREFIF